MPDAGRRRKSVTAIDLGLGWIAVPMLTVDNARFNLQTSDSLAKTRQR